MHDVWPGTTSRASLLRAFMYYVYLFEQWRNWAIPGALLAVMILSIAFVVQGTVAWLFLGFPVGSVGCIGFAILWNVLLRRRGGVRQRLPVPLGKNSYSAVDPLWAHFVTVMCIVMALCLIANVVALNVRIFGALGRCPAPSMLCAHAQRCNGLTGWKWSPKEVRKPIALHSALKNDGCRCNMPEKHDMAHSTTSAGDCGAIIEATGSVSRSRVCTLLSCLACTDSTWPLTA